MNFCYFTLDNQPHPAMTVTKYKNGNIFLIAINFRLATNTLHSLTIISIPR